MAIVHRKLQTVFSDYSCVKQTKWKTFYMLPLTPSTHLEPVFVHSYNSSDGTTMFK